MASPEVTAPVEPVPVPASVDPKASVWPPSGGDVSVVGDSLTVGAQPWLAADFSNSGSNVEVVSAVVGMSTLTGLGKLSYASNLNDTVIVALGTNDLGATSGDVVGWLNRAREIVGPDRHLVWVNLSIDSPLYPHDDVVNAVLRESVARDPRLMVLDWAGYVRDNAISNTTDGIHYESADYQRRAQFYTCAVTQSPACRPYQLH